MKQGYHVDIEPGDYDSWRTATPDPDETGEFPPVRDEFIGPDEHDAAFAARMYGEIADALDAQAELAALADRSDDPDAWRDDFHPPKAWVAELEKSLLGRGYFGNRLRAVVDRVVADGTAETLPAGLLIFPSDRAMIERHVPDAPPADWARHDGVAWNLVETAEGRR